MTSAAFTACLEPLALHRARYAQVARAASYDMDVPGLDEILRNIPLAARSFGEGLKDSGAFCLETQHLNLGTLRAFQPAFTRPVRPAMGSACVHVVSAHLGAPMMTSSTHLQAQTFLSCGSTGLQDTADEIYSAERALKRGLLF